MPNFSSHYMHFWKFTSVPAYSWMAVFVSKPQPKKLTVFLNISFISLVIFFVTVSYFLEQPNDHNKQTSNSLAVVEGLTMKNDGCSDLHDYKDSKSKCMYVKSQPGCRPEGYINYLKIFYCAFGRFLILGRVVLLLWLLVLFYLLGNTAAEFFCNSLENLSKILNLSPTVAGVTLLSLGNGASDVFSCIISFTRSNNGDFGLNSVLGGAFFVSSAVVGVLSTLISNQEISVDKSSFIRDVSFFLFSLASLLLIISIGTITLWAAISFLAIYLFYVCVVCFMHFRFREDNQVNPSSISPPSKDFAIDEQKDVAEIDIPLLGYSHLDDNQQNLPCFLTLDSPSCYYLGRFLFLLDLPLYLPRRLTIPVLNEERWSKPYAVISATLAPLLLAALCNNIWETKLSSKTSLVTYLTAGLTGIILGSLAIITTKKSSPPKNHLFPWLAGGFVMSVSWTYIIAGELVSLLVSLSYIFGIDPSVLGLTVLAWGNSFGDLIANVSMAMNGGANGVQLAISGCYAGPLFNTLLGLGMSFVISSWGELYPSSSSAYYVLPNDHSLYETIGFLMGGLLWSLVILPRKNMKVDKSLGVGLLAIYSCFIFLRLARDLGILKFHGFSFFNS